MSELEALSEALELINELQKSNNMLREELERINSFNKKLLEINKSYAQKFSDLMDEGLISKEK